ncbi:MAG: hypothetical protein ACHP65_08235, partial [Legionellales bacterium]
MNTSQLQEQITQKWSVLQEKITAIPQAPDTDQMLDVIDSYVDLFTALFGDVENVEAYAKQLSNNSSRAEVDFYLLSLNQLRNSIQKLPFETTIKGKLLSQITDQCALHLLQKFEQNKLSDEDYAQIIKNTRPTSMINTVEVKTWGTKREVS